MAEDIVTEDIPRSAEAAARRCMVLYAVVAAGNRESRADLMNWLRREGLENDISPYEAFFLNSAAPDHQQMVNATWRSEALFVIAWALGKLQDSPAQWENCDVLALRRALPPLFGSTAGFIADSMLRTDEEIFGVSEQIYQRHWTVRDARLHDRPVPDGITPGAVQERHHALNWLIGYCGQDWDDIQTDT